MPDLTLLDYEIFKNLKKQIASFTDGSDSQFSEWVLGYGFSIEGAEDTPSSFVLLCSPQVANDLNQLLHQALPKGLLQIESFQIPIRVCDSIGQQELQHALINPMGEGQNTGQDEIAERVHVALGQSLRQVVLKDHRKIILPAYLLRYTPYTSPNLIILRAALSQIHYLHQSNVSSSGEFEQRSVSARMSEISRWCSFSRTSIYRLLHDDPRSQWLIGVENKGSYQNDQGQQISLPNQYLLEPLHLTPGDATDLFNYLQSHMNEWENLNSCLIALAKLNRRKILAYPYRTPKEDDLPKPASVLEVLQLIFGPIELNAERLALLDKVRNNLIGDDFVAVPWYVLRNLLPVYGASIITLYMMCQPLLYRNGGVQRDTFWLPDGDQALVAWTGDQSVGKYFPKANSKGRGRPASKKGSSDREWRKNKRQMLSDFFLRVDSRKDKEGVTNWKIQVNNYPILPEDERLMASVYAILADLVREDKIDNVLNLFAHEHLENPEHQTEYILDKLYRLPLSSDENQTLTLIVSRIISDFETPDNPEISNFETPVERLISLFAPSVKQSISESATPVIVLFSELETHLKILYRIKDSIKNVKDTNFHPDSYSSDDLGTQNRSADWNFDLILHQVNPKYQEQLMTNPGKLEVFKAWLIHSALNARVNRPLNLAISQSLQEKALPEAAARRLAEAALPDLLDLVEQMLMHPASVGYEHDPDARSMIADLQLLLMGVDQREKAILLQRLIDLLR